MKKDAKCLEEIILIPNFAEKYNTIMKKIIAILMLFIVAFSISIPANAEKSEEKKPV